VAVRYHYIDGLRGVAAAAVMLHHFYAQSAYSPVLGFYTPAFLATLMNEGDLGVDVFFVISGFVIAYSVGDDRVTPGYLANFALRRSIRLDPPYWAAIAVTLANHWLGDRLPGGPSAPMPSAGAILANMVYLHRVVGYAPVVLVSWTLCHEVQFYLLYIALFGLAQRLAGRGPTPRPERSAAAFVVFGGTGVLSVLAPMKIPRFETVFCGNTWYLFVVGVMCQWMVSKKIRASYGWIYLGAVGLILCPDNRVAATLVRAATALSILVAGSSGQLENWLRFRPVQALGRVSYSLYLLHAVLGWRLLSLGYESTGRTARWGCLWLTAAVLASLAAATLLYWLVERPTARLARRLKPGRREAGPAPAGGGFGGG